MTDELDTLRPEVREAINRQDRQERCDEYCPVCEDRATILAELRRLAKIEEERWAVVATRNGALERAEKAEAELAALKARIAEAPMAVVQSAPGAIKASFHGYGCFEYTAENLQPKLRGKRVRLVVEK